VARILVAVTTTKQAGKSGSGPGPTVFVLFGATGDLAKRLVLPAFYRLACDGLLPREWRLVGNGRGDVAHENFRAHVHQVLTEFGPRPGKQEWEPFAQRVFFAGGGFSSDSPAACWTSSARPAPRWVRIRSSSITWPSRRSPSPG